VEKPTFGASVLLLARPGDAVVFFMGIGPAHKVNPRGTKEPEKKRPSPRIKELLHGGE